MNTEENLKIDELNNAHANIELFKKQVSDIQDYFNNNKTNVDNGNLVKLITKVGTDLDVLTTKVADLGTQIEEEEENVRLAKEALLTENFRKIDSNAITQLKFTINNFMYKMQLNLDENSANVLVELGSIVTNTPIKFNVIRLEKSVRLFIPMKMIMLSESSYYVTPELRYENSGTFAGHVICIGKSVSVKLNYLGEPIDFESTSIFVTHFKANNVEEDYTLNTSILTFNMLTGESFNIRFVSTNIQPLRKEGIGFTISSKTIDNSTN